MNIIEFSRLFHRHQGVSFPVLIELHHDEKGSWYFTSNNIDVYYNNQWYIAVPMSYKFPGSRDGVPQGGSLEIDIDQQKPIGSEYTELLKWFDEVDDEAYMEVVALINEEGEVDKLSQLTQRHGSVTWDGEKITWTLGADDRMEMQVNPWLFNVDSLTG